MTQKSFESKTPKPVLLNLTETDRKRLKPSLQKVVRNDQQNRSCADPASAFAFHPLEGLSIIEHTYQAIILLDIPYLLPHASYATFS